MCFKKSKLKLRSRETFVKFWIKTSDPLNIELFIFSLKSDPDKPGQNKMTPAHVAARYNNPKIIFPLNYLHP